MVAPPSTTTPSLAYSPPPRRTTHQETKQPADDQVQQLVALAKASKQPAPAQRVAALCNAMLRRLDDASIREIALVTWAAGKLARYACHTPWHNLVTQRFCRAPEATQNNTKHQHRIYRRSRSDVLVTACNTLVKAIIQQLAARLHEAKATLAHVFAPLTPAELCMLLLGLSWVRVQAPVRLLDAIANEAVGRIDTFNAQGACAVVGHF